MKNIDQITAKWLSEAPEILIKGRVRSLTLGNIEEKNGEGYSLSLHKEKIIIDAQSSLGLAYGISRIKNAYISQDYSFLKKMQQPRFACRPLWLIGNEELQIVDGVCVALPDFLLHKEDNIEKLALTLTKRIIELGYNAIIFGEQFDAQTTQHTSEKSKKMVECGSQILRFQTLCNALHEAGIKIIIKPLFGYLGKIKKDSDNGVWNEFLLKKTKEIVNKYDTIGAFFISSTASEINNNTASITCYDAVLKELVQYEQALQDAKTDLILMFYIPASDPHEALRQMTWLPKLIEEGAKNTTFCFSAVAGGSSRIDFPLHPVWEYANSSVSLSRKALMPIINAGGIGLGNGLWPAISFKGYELLTDDHLYKFLLGGICASSYLPVKSSVLDEALWIGGQIQWQTTSPALLEKIWLKKYLVSKSEIESIITLFELCRTIICEISYMKNKTSKEEFKTKNPTDDVRLRAEMVLSQLKWLQHLSSFHQDNEEILVNTIFDLILYFCRDARRIVLHYLLSHGVNMPQVLSGDDMLEAFWTELPQMNGNGFNAVSRVILRETPNKDAVGSKLADLFNTMFLFI